MDDLKKLNNLVVVSDTHSGSRLALCPPGIKLDDGGEYIPSPLQQKMWAYWQDFWEDFVPEATKGEPYAIVHNGDAVEGNHHDDVSTISTNPEDQQEIAYQILKPLIEKCEGRFYLVRGTKAHVGPSGHNEENLAKRLGAIPSAEGKYARWELWKYLGGGDKLVHFLHHVGTTGSNAYEATAVHKELVESYVEAARTGERPPDMVVRSHRHRAIKTSIPVSRDHKAGWADAVVTPCWQARTPFVWKVPGGRLSLPQFGGVVVRHAHGRLFADVKVYSIERSEPE